jgi:hypothetical protein
MFSIIYHSTLNLDKEKDGQHRGIAFVTFASSAGLLQALSRGGDDLMGRNIAVKRREGKANPAASNVSKTASATEKQSYYTDTNGLSRAAEKIEEKSSRPGSRFSSSSSGAVGSVTQGYGRDSIDVPARTERQQSINERVRDASIVQSRDVTAPVRSQGREESSRGHEGDNKKGRDDSHIERRERRRSRSRSRSTIRRRSSRDSKDRGDSQDTRRERGSRLGRRDDTKSDARHRRSTSRSRNISRSRRSKSRSPVRRAVRGSDRARSWSASSERGRSKRARPSDADRRRADDGASNSKSKRESSDNSSSQSDSDS